MIPLDNTCSGIKNDIMIGFIGLVCHKWYFYLFWYINASVLSTKSAWNSKLVSFIKFKTYALFCLHFSAFKERWKICSNNPITAHEGLEERYLSNIMLGHLLRSHICRWLNIYSIYHFVDANIENVEFAKLYPFLYAWICKRNKC